jgi:predicted kinase
LKPTVTFLIGLPASGKSTFYEKFNCGEHRFSTDDEIEAIAKEQGKTYSDVFQAAFKDAEIRAHAKLATATEARRDIVWDQTNLGVGKRESNLRKFSHEYYKVGICFLPPRWIADFDELKRRLNNRPGKTIPWSVILDMISRYQMPTITEGFDELQFIDPFDQTRHEIHNIQEIFTYFFMARKYAQAHKEAVAA